MQVLKRSLISIMSLSLLLPMTAASKTYSLGGGTQPNSANHKAVVVANGDTVKRVCYYQDQAYTEGAIIKVEGFVLQCSEANDYEQNGALKWVQLTSND